MYQIIDVGGLMKDFKDKVAVITGAASGIGYALAKRCAKEKMNVVLADIEKEALAKAEKEIKKTGVNVLSALVDVSKAGDIETLARKTLDTFGAVHLLFNNAGVGAIVGKKIWELTLADWEWVISVNLWGVIHGVRIFVPIMLSQDNECHIVNTSSMQGLTSFPTSAIYKVTKHGVVSLSETLHHELTMEKSKIKVSVLCPAFVRTNIRNAARNRPAVLGNEPAIESENTANQQTINFFKDGVQSGTPPEQTADAVFKAIREEKFYILPHPEWKFAIQLRMEDILQERNPTDALAAKDR